MKQTFQPKKKPRKRNHGFRARMSSKSGRRIINSRRSKGRTRLAA
jgi:large subunit ribosomal protein L34